MQLGLQLGMQQGQLVCNWAVNTECAGRFTQGMLVHGKTRLAHHIASKALRTTSKSNLKQTTLEEMFVRQCRHRECNLSPRRVCLSLHRCSLVERPGVFGMGLGIQFRCHGIWSCCQRFDLWHVLTEYVVADEGMAIRLRGARAV